MTSKPVTMVEKKLLSADNALGLIDSTLNSYFLGNIQQAEMLDSHYATLWQSSYRVFQAGGKRIRPYVTLLSFQAFSDKSVQDIVPIAAAQELLHIALLIHDDIIDRDYIRHGIDNVSGQYDKFYSPYITDVAERRHFSDSAAILAGDLLISGGYQLIQTSTLPADKIRLASQIFSQAIFTVAGGELLDTESAFRPSGSITAITIARNKTAHYSFVTPLTMGAQLAGVDDKTIADLVVFGENIGIAYQLVDDMISMFGSQSVIGKSNMSDIQEAKHTFLVEQLVQHGNADQMVIFDTLFGKADISPDEAVLFRELLISSGAKSRTETAIATYTQKALDALKSIPLSAESRIAFETLVERALEREQ